MAAERQEPERAKQPFESETPFAAVVVAPPPKWKPAVVVVFPVSKVSPVKVVEAREEETVFVRTPMLSVWKVEEAEA